MDEYYHKLRIARAASGVLLLYIYIFFNYYHKLRGLFVYKLYMDGYVSITYTLVVHKEFNVTTEKLVKQHKLECTIVVSSLSTIRYEIHFFKRKKDVGMVVPNVRKPEMLLVCKQEKVYNYCHIPAFSL